MYDIDSILTVVENPTRRRILQAIVREPHYPLQLSKELGISQQAIVKNLALMEKSGVVTSQKVSGERGPDRIVYSPNAGFTVVIDYRNGMFRANIMPCETAVEEENSKENPEINDARARRSEIDSELDEMDKTRSSLIEERNSLINGIIGDMNESEIDYVHRTLLYEFLNSPNSNMSQISRALGMNEDTLSEMMNEMIDLINIKERR